MIIFKSDAERKRFQKDFLSVVTTNSQKRKEFFNLFKLKDMNEADRDFLCETALSASYAFIVQNNKRGFQNALKFTKLAFEEAREDSQEKDSALDQMWTHAKVYAMQPNDMGLEVVYDLFKFIVKHGDENNIIRFALNRVLLDIDLYGGRNPDLQSLKKSHFMMHLLLSVLDTQKRRPILSNHSIKGVSKK